MEKLLNALSELTLKSEYISIEIREIECLLNKITDSIEMLQRSINADKNKTLNIENFKCEEKHLFTKLKGRVTQLQLSWKLLESLKIDFQNLASSDGHTFHNLDDKKLEKLKSHMKLFSIDFEAHYLDSKICRAKVLFSKNKYLIINYNFVDNTYDLQSMDPNHVYFNEMRNLLLESGDIVGFLCGSRTYVQKYLKEDVLF